MLVKRLKHYDVSTEETFNRTLRSLNNFDVLEITEIPSTQDATGLFSQLWFKEGLSSLTFTSIKFVVDEELKIVNPSNIALGTYEGAILVALESSVIRDCQFYWKLSGSNADIYSLKVNAGCIEFVQKFLQISLRDGFNGLYARFPASTLSTFLFLRNPLQCRQAQFKYSNAW